MTKEELQKPMSRDLIPTLFPVFQRMAVTKDGGSQIVYRHTDGALTGMKDGYKLMLPLGPTLEETEQTSWGTIEDFIRHVGKYFNLSNESN